MHTSDTMLLICIFIKMWTHHISSFQNHTVVSQVLSSKKTPHTIEGFYMSDAILVEFKTILHVIVSAAEAEVGRVLHNT